MSNNATHTEDPDMLERIKSIAAQSPDTLLQDAVGAVALMVMLYGALHLPTLV